MSDTTPGHHVLATENLIDTKMPTRLESFPNELILDIFDLLVMTPDPTPDTNQRARGLAREWRSHQRTLRNLTLVSRRFSAMATRRLYRVIIIDDIKQVFVLLSNFCTQPKLRDHVHFLRLVKLGAMDDKRDLRLPELVANLVAKNNLDDVLRYYPDDKVWPWLRRLNEAYMGGLDMTSLAGTGGENVAPVSNGAIQLLVDALLSWLPNAATIHIAGNPSKRPLRGDPRPDWSFARTSLAQPILKAPTQKGALGSVRTVSMSDVDAGAWFLPALTNTVTDLHLTRIRKHGAAFWESIHGCVSNAHCLQLHQKHPALWIFPTELFWLCREARNLDSLFISLKCDIPPTADAVEEDDLLDLGVTDIEEPNLYEGLQLRAQHLKLLVVVIYGPRSIFEAALGMECKLPPLNHLSNLNGLQVTLQGLFGDFDDIFIQSEKGVLDISSYLPPNLTTLGLVVDWLPSVNPGIPGSQEYEVQVVLERILRQIVRLKLGGSGFQRLDSLLLSCHDEAWDEQIRPNQSKMSKSMERALDDFGTAGILVELDSHKRHFCWPQRR